MEHIFTDDDDRERGAATLACLSVCLSAAADFRLPRIKCPRHLIHGLVRFPASNRVYTNRSESIQTRAASNSYCECFSVQKNQNKKTRFWENFHHTLVEAANRGKFEKNCSVVLSSCWCSSAFSLLVPLRVPESYREKSARCGRTKQEELGIHTDRQTTSDLRSKRVWYRFPSGLDNFPSAAAIEYSRVGTENQSARSVLYV